MHAGLCHRGARAFENRISDRCRRWGCLHAKARGIASTKKSTPPEKETKQTPDAYKMRAKKHFAERSNQATPPLVPLPKKQRVNTSDTLKMRHSHGAREQPEGVAFARRRFLFFILPLPSGIIDPGEGGGGELPVSLPSRTPPLATGKNFTPTDVSRWRAAAKVLVILRLQFELAPHRVTSPLR